MTGTSADPPLPDAPRDPGGAPPKRRPGSVRRTSTVLMHWPEGFGTDLFLDGRARDLLTRSDGSAEVLAEDDYRIQVAPDRTIRTITVTPDRPGIGRLVGARGGAALRSALKKVVPDEERLGTPLYLILDDVAGSTLIAGFAWSRWTDSWMANAPTAGRSTGGSRRTMAGVCAGFRPGSRALLPDGTSNQALPHNVADVPPLADRDDELGWHRLDPHPPVAMRRARRIDARLESGVLKVDAMFRDSCWRPDGTEVAVHEYSIDATIDPEAGRLVSVTARPRVLPYAECPAAAPKASWLEGATVRDLRSGVLERLRSTDCCTHLNDALRSLAEVPILAAVLGTTK